MAPRTNQKPPHCGAHILQGVGRRCTVKVIRKGLTQTGRCEAGKLVSASRSLGLRAKPCPVTQHSPPLRPCAGLPQRRLPVKSTEDRRVSTTQVPSSASAACWLSRGAGTPSFTGQELGFSAISQLFTWHSGKWRQALGRHTARSHAHVKHSQSAHKPQKIYSRAQHTEQSQSTQSHNMQSHTQHTHTFITHTPNIMQQIPTYSHNIHRHNTHKRYNTTHTQTIHPHTKHTENSHATHRIHIKHILTQHIQNSHSVQYTHNTVTYSYNIHKTYTQQTQPLPTPHTQHTHSHNTHIQVSMLKCFHVKSSGQRCRWTRPTKQVKVNETKTRKPGGRGVPTEPPQD